MLKTLLDLFPGTPKRDLIQWMPVRIYANGGAHSEEKLLAIITEIEGGKRAAGRPSNKKVEELANVIPQIWLK